MKGQRVLANNRKYLGGAIDLNGADKGSRFMQLRDAHDIPTLHFCDTPGIMVGPEVKIGSGPPRQSDVCHRCQSHRAVFHHYPRKAYGLVVIIMASSAYKAAYFCVSWSTEQFGGMGLEGAVKLGYRNDLAAIEDPEERLAKCEGMVAKLYDNGTAMNQASYFEFDDTIEPADTWRWVVNLLKSIHLAPKREGRNGPAADTP
ncbi:MAG: hypothetical protein OSB46_02670 [Alphaproteobacteria bacterium]|nr:hypothetical protein [Alphaproteobacteria bacterium]